MISVKYTILLSLGLFLSFSGLSGLSVDEWSLVDAARLGNDAEVKRLLDAGVNPDVLDDNKLTPLKNALLRSNTESARLLLEHGASINRLEKGTYESPLMVAAGEGSISIVKLLLKKGADITEQMDDSSRLPLTAFEKAAYNGQLEMLREMDRMKLLPKDRSTLNRLAHFAASENHPQTLEHLIKLGADINAKIDNNTFLTNAIERNSIAAVTKLLELGVNPNIASTGRMFVRKMGNPERTPLVSAVIMSNLEAVTLLLDHGADPTLQDNFAIKFADLNGDREIYRLLLEAGAKKPEPYSFGKWMNNYYKYEKNAANTPSSNVKAAELISQLNIQDHTVSLSTDLKFQSPHKVAIIAKDKTHLDAESMLISKLSNVENAEILDRSSIDKVKAEHRLFALGGKVPQHALARQAGKILRADIVILVKDINYGDILLRETKAISTRTGMVLALDISPEKNSNIETWAHSFIAAVVNKANQEQDNKAFLIAIPEIISGKDDAFGRNLVSQATFLLTRHLTRTDNVVLLERREIDQLLAEEADTSAYIQSSWIIDGEINYDAPQQQIELTLHLYSPTAKQKHTIVRSGSLSQMSTLAASLANEMASTMGHALDMEESLESEAEARSKQAENFASLRMWKEASVYGEAAAALGYTSEDLVYTRLNAISKRIITQSTYLFERKQKEYGYRNIAANVSYRAPFLMPPLDDHELSFPEVIEQSMLLLDIAELNVPVIKKNLSEDRFLRLFAAIFWDAASAPLIAGTAVSYQEEYGEEFDTLRKRILQLHTEIMGEVRNLPDKLLLHSMIAVKNRLAPYWTTTDDEFMEIILTSIKEAREHKYGQSEHAVLSSLEAIAFDNIRIVGGRRARLWYRLAKKMKDSEDLTESYIGIILEASGRFNIYHHVQALYDAKDKSHEFINNIGGYEGSTFLASYDPEYLLNERETKYSVSTGHYWPGDWLYSMRSLAGGSSFDNNLGIRPYGDRREPAEWRYHSYYNALALLDRLERDNQLISIGRYQPYFRNGWTKEEFLFFKKRYEEISEQFPINVANITHEENERRKELKYRISSMKYAYEKAFPFEHLKEVKPIILKEPRSLMDTFVPPHLFDRASVNIGTYPNFTDRRDNSYYYSMLWSHPEPKNPKGSQQRFQVFYYKIDSKGHPYNIVKVPLQEEHASPNTRVASNRYLAVQVDLRKYAKRDENNRINFLVTERDYINWKIYKPIELEARQFGSYDIIGDHIVYIYRHNPNPKDTSVHSYVNTGDPSYFVRALNMKTGEDIELANSRRAVPRNPLEELRGAQYKRVHALSEQHFYISTSAGKPKHYYDLTTGEWKDLASRKRQSPPNPNAFSRTIRVDDIDWRVSGMSSGTITFALPDYSKRLFIKVPYEIDVDAFQKHHPKKLRELRDIEGKKPSEIRFTARLEQDGLMAFAPNGFYFWVPNEELVESIRTAYEFEMKNKK